MKKKLYIFYRISDAGYKKEKPDYINNEACLKNAVQCFPPKDVNWKVIADNCCDNTLKMIETYIDEKNIMKVSIGDGAGTFNLALDKAIELDDDAWVYFIENDYVHKAESNKILCEALSSGLADYVTLYDHPDKYINSEYGGNPYVELNGEISRVCVTKSCHWKTTNSTTMTFATTIKFLKRDKPIWKKWTATKHPNDFEAFIELYGLERFLISPMPGYSTHGETKWLSLFTNWRDMLEGDKNEE